MEIGSVASLCRFCHAKHYDLTFIHLIRSVRNRMDKKFSLSMLQASEAGLARLACPVGLDQRVTSRLFDTLPRLSIGDFVFSRNSGFYMTDDDAVFARALLPYTG